MKKTTIWILVCLQLLLNVSTASAEIQSSECLLPASKTQFVSLGMPLPLERLGNRSRIRVGVLPFYFSGEKENQLSKSEEGDYLNAALEIEKLANQNVDVEVVFLPSKNANISASKFKEIYHSRGRNWDRNDLSTSTWGFVKRTLLDADSTVNFSNLDSVILVGSNMDSSFSIAEAMQFFRGEKGNSFEGANSDFFKSINTEEGFIDNAILLDSHTDVFTIAHELLHNFGLTDLYGGVFSPRNLSIMAAGSNLLNYEKAVLGWFPIQNFRCENYINVIKNDSIENVYSLSNTRVDSIDLIKVSEEKAYILEVINEENKSNLILYELEQNNRPPIRLSASKLPYGGLINLRNPEFIGTAYRTLDFDLLISDVITDSAQLYLIPSNLVNSIDAADLLEKILDRRKEKLSLILASEKISPSKKVTMICVKGKKTKKVTAVKPMCPKGFAKK